MIKTYAPNSDIKMIVAEKEISASQIKRFLGNRGIFSMVQNTDELSNEIYPIFFGCSDVEHLQGMMQTTKNYQKSSILTLEPSDKTMKLDEFQDLVADEFNRYRNKNSKYRLEDVHKDKEGNLHLKMVYTKKVKGKIGLLKDKTKEIDVKIEKRADDKKLLIDVRQNDNSDLKEFDAFILQLSAGGHDSKLFNIGYITLDKLTSENKIKFFDDLIAFKHKEWRLEDIKGVDVKKGESLEDDEEIEEEFSSDELAGINSAVFKGNSIRDTGIVQKFLKENFHFTSMKFKYIYSKSNESFIVDVNFKTNDNIKIDIIKTYEREDNSDRDLICVLPSYQQEDIIITFQNVAYRIYNNLLDLQGKNLI